MITDVPIKITNKAFSKIKQIMQQKSVPEGYGLRVGKSNAVSCGTTSFVLGFDTKKTGDDLFNFEDIEVIINKKDILFLLDITLDYEEGEEVSGFKFEKDESH